MRAMAQSIAVAAARPAKVAQIAITAKSMAQRYLRSNVSMEKPELGQATAGPPAGAPKSVSDPLLTSSPPRGSPANLALPRGLRSHRRPGSRFRARPVLLRGGG